LKWKYSHISIVLTGKIQNNTSVSCCLDCRCDILLSVDC